MNTILEILVITIVVTCAAAFAVYRVVLAFKGKASCCSGANNTECSSRKKSCAACSGCSFVIQKDKT